MTTPEQREEHRAYLMTPWNWRALIRRAQGITKGDKYILCVLADYAGKTGIEVKPGIALLAADSESSYRQARDAVALARRLGLLFLAKAGNKRGKVADEYWLIMHPDAMELAAAEGIEYETPEARKVRAEHIRVARRENVARYAKPVSGALSGYQKDEDLTPAAGTKTETSVTRTGHQKAGFGTRTGPQEPVFGALTGPPTSPVLTNHVVENPTPPTVDASPTDVTAPRATARDKDQIFIEVESTPTPGDVVTTPAKPTVAGTLFLAPPHHPAERDDQFREQPPTPVREKCPHGNNPRRRKDGTPRCEECRTAQQDSTPDAVAEVIPVPTVTAPGRFTVTKCADHGLPAAKCLFCRRQLPGRAAA